MKYVGKKTKKEILEKFYNQEYQQKAKIEGLARRFNKTPNEIDREAASMKNCYDLFVEDSTIKQLALEFNISEKTVDKIVDDETEDFCDKKGIFEEKEKEKGASRQ